MTGVKVDVLGPFDLEVDGEPVTLGAGRLRELLTLLALAPDAPVPLGRLAESMWPARMPESPRRSS